MAAKLKDLSAPARWRLRGRGGPPGALAGGGHCGQRGLVTPCVLLISGGLYLASGHNMIAAKEARHVLHSLSLLGPTTLFAAFTGVLLFASSLIAGWVENWFVLHRLDSAGALQPAHHGVLGARADRWARFMRDNISGLAANISLGFMLGWCRRCWPFWAWGWRPGTSRCPPASWPLPWPARAGRAARAADFWWAVAGHGGDRAAQPGRELLPGVPPGWLQSNRPSGRGPPPHHAPSGALRAAGPSCGRTRCPAPSSRG
jgi:hypothetical protein